MCTCSADTAPSTIRVWGNPPILRLSRAAPIDLPANFLIYPRARWLAGIFDHSEIYTFHTCLIYYFVSPVDIYTRKARNPVGFGFFFPFPHECYCRNFCANRKKINKNIIRKQFSIFPAIVVVVVVSRASGLYDAHRAQTNIQLGFRKPNRFYPGVFYIYINYIVFFGNGSPGHKSRARPSSDLVWAIYNNSFAIHIPRSADLFPTHRKTRA